MIQDIAPHQFKNEYRAIPPKNDSVVLYYEEHASLMRRTPQGIEFPTFGELERLNEDIYENSTYLFTIDEKQYYLAENLNRELLSEFTMENTEIFGQSSPSILHLRGSRDISCIGGIRHADIVDAVDIRCVMIQKRGCFFVNTAGTWNFQKSVLRLSLE